MTHKTSPSDEVVDEREDAGYSYPALKVDQNGHLIYFTTMPIDDLFPFCFVERHNENPEQGYQRKYDERRANEIAEYLNTEGDSIPINIVLSAQPAAELTYNRKNKQLSYLRVPEAFAVLDGQHRLWGYQKCPARHRVPVAIYAGLDQSTEARLFLDINNKHRGVPKSLLLNVKSVAGTETESEAGLRILFMRLNNDESSPLRGKLSFGESSAGKLSRATFDSAVGRAQKSDSLRKLPADKQYELVLNFIRAFHAELEEKAFLLKRNYFCAIFEIFDEVVKIAKKEHGSAKLAALQQVVSRVCDLSEESPQASKRQSLVEAMRNRLHSDTSISDDDI